MIIHAFTEDLELLRYVETIGLPLNSKWRIKERLPFDGPLILHNDERELQITRHAAEFIYIQ